MDVMNVGSIIRTAARSVLKLRRRIRKCSETALKNRFKSLFLIYKSGVSREGVQSLGSSSESENGQKRFIRSSSVSQSDH
jgi:hypothetical protein